MTIRSRAWRTAIACSCVLGGAVAVACGSFAGSDTPASPDDAGVDGAMRDGATIDGGAGTDATFDGGLNPAVCPVLFADSFDMLDLGHWAADVAGGGTVSLDSNDFGDAAPSLRGALTLEGGAQDHAAIYRLQPFSGTGVGSSQLTFAMKIEAPVGALTYEEMGCEIQLRNGAGDETQGFFSRFSGGAIVVHATAYLDGGVSTQIATLINDPGLTGWFDGTITVVPGPEGAQFTFTLRDRATGTVYSAPISGSPPPNVDHARITCGVTYATLDLKDGGAAVETHVDDVTFRHCSP